jgi:hypothetical protein
VKINDFDSSLHENQNTTVVVPVGAILRIGNTLMENTSCSGDVNITLYEFKNGTNEGVVVAFNDDYIDPATNESTGCSYLEWTNPTVQRRMRRLLAIDEPPTFLAIILCVQPPCTASTRGEVAIPLRITQSSPRPTRRALINDLEITLVSVFVLLGAALVMTSMVCYTTCISTHKRNKQNTDKLLPDLLPQNLGAPGRNKIEGIRRPKRAIYLLHKGEIVI